MKRTTPKLATALADVDAPRARNGKRTPTTKQKAFAREYVKDFNGTQSALATYDTKDAKTASVIAAENLAKPSVRGEIQRLLQENGVDMSEIVTIHRRNMIQDKHLPTSQKAVADFYEILGMKTPDKAANAVQIAFVIEK